MTSPTSLLRKAGVSRLSAYQEKPFLAGPVPLAPRLRIPRRNARSYVSAVATDPTIITKGDQLSLGEKGSARRGHVATLGIPSRTDWQPLELPNTLRELGEAISSPSFRKLMSSPQTVVQAAYTVARTTFFTGQVMVSATQFNIKNEYQAFNLNNPLAAVGKFWKNTRGVYGSIAELHRMDLENVKKGYYRAPYDMHPSHRQWRPSFIAENNARLIKFGKEFLVRREKEGRWEVVENMPHLKEEQIYPDYYLQNFHYQTDGWLSEDSARVYEYSTEALFFGCQDAMQRQSLVPLHFFMKGRDPSQIRMADVACGTGRFLTFVKDNYPTMHATGVDLSPYYLAVAKENMDYFREFDRSVNGDRGMRKAEYLQANAEELPFASNSLDVVSTVYLFHELPPQARKNVVKEMHRVLKPGGIVIFNDSLQKGDRPEADKTLSWFPKNYHEPYYMSYVNTDMVKLFGGAGFQHESTQIAHVSKVMCFRKI